jgi:hyperosmotically inducible periplasmic protein
VRSTCTPAALAAVLLATGLAVAPGASFADDGLRAREVWLQVRDAPGFTIFDSVDVTVQGAMVVLRGRVTRAATRDALAARAGVLAGIREVRNHLVVLPVSARDDDLRLRLARAIYGNPSFRAYGAMVHPPIHIIVEDGHVTLEGVVETAVDRSLAGSIAAAFDVAVVNALRTRMEAGAGR